MEREELDCPSGGLSPKEPRWTHSGVIGDHKIPSLEETRQRVEPVVTDLVGTTVDNEEPTAVAERGRQLGY